MKKTQQWVRFHLQNNGILRPRRKKNLREKIAYYLLGIKPRKNLWRMIFGDKGYTTSTLQEIKDIIAKCSIDRKNWIPETGDCDNFSFWFSANSGLKYKNNSIGVVWGWVTDKDGKKQKHAWNVFITDAEEVYFLEPQTDEIMLVKGGEAQGTHWKYFGVSRVFFF